MCVYVDSDATRRFKIISCLIFVKEIFVDDVSKFKSIRKYNIHQKRGEEVNLFLSF